VAAARKRSLLDTTTRQGKHVQSRLKREVVIWLATVGPKARPLVVPVWFLWDGDSFLVYSVPGAKVRNIERNPAVQLHLNATDDGDDVVRVEGTAQILKRQPPAYKVPAYIRKYATRIKSYGLTPAGFSEQYRVPVRVRPTKFH
jgi:PPOX class probable F420-dependent enzyme